jgi:hypothetical protein
MSDITVKLKHLKHHWAMTQHLRKVVDETIEHIEALELRKHELEVALDRALNAAHSSRE